MTIDDIKKAMINTDEVEELANLFKVFGDSTRTKIINSLILSKLNVTDICLCVNMNKSAVSHQLRILRDAKLVKTEKIGKEVYYSLDDDHVLEVFNLALTHVREED